MPRLVLASASAKAGGDPARPLVEARLAPTARDVVQQLETLGGVVEIENGRAYVTCEATTAALIPIAQTVYLLERALVEAHQQATGRTMGTLDPSDVPAQPFTGAGALIPPRLNGRVPSYDVAP